uniref:Si:dkey-17e16.9 n=1 Tax=Hucho hucho TaxID=62062 RepID=A0A4W5NZ33_9TELE
MAILVQHQYKIYLNTGDFLHSYTSDIIYATLIGTDGTSERTNLANSGLDFMTGKVRTYTVTTPSTLGHLLLVKLEKEQYLFLPENKWFCSKVVVTTPEHDVIYFPCYKCVSRGEVHMYTCLCDCSHFSVSISVCSCPTLRWNEFAEGLPKMNSAKELSALPAEVLFSFSKEVETIYTRESGMLELKLKGLADSTKQWEDLDKMEQVFWFRKTPISEYVSEHWKKDDFFGSQFLNGTNPNVIQRCTTLPTNFPVTDEMVQPSMEDGSSLATEMKKGNIFICDYKRLENVPTRVVNGEPLPLTAALCLFYNNPEDNLIPIAIQLEQQPSVQNPIYLPSDSEHDWLLAKMFVRNADFIEHQNSYHLLGTHLLAEAFAMATLRSLPIMHPLHKLLIPHFRYTLPVNLSQKITKKAHSEITYSSLCLPENIVARGLESIPNFYYREDGLKLWNIINRCFVQGMVEHFYSSDSEVSRDSELQDWINEIFIHGFLGNGKSGIPQRFDTVKEVIKFITMVIFTVSAQHSAVSMGQFDYCSWVLNSPIFLCKAPPTTKGSSSMSTIFETLPDVGSTVRGMASIWLLSKKYSDFIPLGSYPNQYFDETDGYFDVTKQMMKHFQAELSYLSESIIERNSTLTLPYNYLNPAEMENSVSM